MIERHLPLIATRKATAVRVDAYRAVPLTIQLSIPDEIGSLAGATILRAEIRASRTDATTTALAGTSIAAPSGQSFDLTFTSAQMNQSLAGEESSEFWLVVYAIYPPGVIEGSTELELDVFASIDLVLHEHAASLTAPNPPNAAIALTKTQADLLYMPLGSGTPGTGTVTSVSVVSANGVSGTVVNASSTPAITIALGAITPTSVTATGQVRGNTGVFDTGATITGSANFGNNTVFVYGTNAAANHRSALGLGSLATQSGTFSGASSGTNTGDQTITLTGDVTGSGTGSFATALATLSPSPAGAYINASITIDAKGRVTAATSGTGGTTAASALTGDTLASNVIYSSLTTAAGGAFGSGAYAAAFNPASPGAIGGTTPANVRATNFTQTALTNSLGNTNWQDLTVWNFIGNSKANILSSMGLDAFSDVTHKGIIIPNALTISSSGTTGIFTYATGAAAIHRAALELGTAAQSSTTDFLQTDFSGNANIATVGTITTGMWFGTPISLGKGGTGATTAAGARNALELGSLATLSPTGTASSATFLRGDNTWATPTGGAGLTGTGSIDNAILRADGTGGSTLQSSNVRIEDSGQVTWQSSLGAITHILGPTDQNLVISSPTMTVAGAAKAITITGGLPLTAGGNSPGGAINIKGGDAGTGSGAGGSVNIDGGKGNSGSSGAGGSINITAGADDAGSSTGTIYLTIPQQSRSSSTNLNYGQIVLRSLGHGATTAASLLTVLPILFQGGPGGATTNASGTGGGGGGSLFTLGAGGASSGTTAATGGPGGPFTVTGGAGGAATGTSGPQTGGAGSAITLTSGTGGTATSASSGTRTGGNGGALTIATGAGGAGTTVQGNSGSITLATGAGQFPGSIIATIAGGEKFRVASDKISCAVPLGLPSYTVGTAPTPTTNAGAMIYVTDDIGGAVPAFSDATNWRRVTDRAAVSVA